MVTANLVDCLDDEEDEEVEEVWTDNMRATFPSTDLSYTNEPGHQIL